MNTSTAISVYEHFLYINESLQLSVNDYPDIDAIWRSADDQTEFTYYDFVFRDHLNIRTILAESNITNLDAHYILKKFIETLINSKSERSKSRLSKPFTYDDYLFLADEEEEDIDGHFSYLIDIIVNIIEEPQYLFEFIAEFGTFNITPKYAPYPYKHIENHGKIPYVLAAYISHLPFKIWSHKIDYDIKFTSYKEAEEWQNEFYKFLADNRALEMFLRLKDLAEVFISRIKTLDNINVDLGFDFYQMQKELNFRNNKLAFIDSSQANIAPELIVAHYVWNYIYLEDNDLNQNLSHSSKVPLVLKHFKGLPKDQRFIDRITAITTPREQKNYNWSGFFK